MPDQVRPEDIIIETGEQTVRNRDGGVTKTKHIYKIGTLDLLVIFAGLVAVIFALGMIASLIQVNKGTLAVVGLSGVASAVSGALRPRRQEKLLS